MMLFVAALLLVEILTIMSTRGLKWRLVNLGIILAFTGLGFGIGYAAFGGLVRIPLAVSTGAAGAAGCSVWNKWRRKAAG